MTQPIFILSLPRSGSTLLQRMLLADGECATLGETSLLLRFLGDAHQVTRYAVYREHNIEISKNDIRAKWPGFDAAYRAGIRDIMSKIYKELAAGKRYFIDKTPRYTLILDEIYQTFPDAKFIVLWRHPLAVAASICTSFHHNIWSLQDFELDLTVGLDRLYQFQTQMQDRVCSIRYEDLVQTPLDVLNKLEAYLGLKNLSQVLEKELPSETGGRLGDPTGVGKYQHISSASRDTWAEQYNNWFRIRWAKRYYQHTRSTWLKEMGYTIPDTIQTASRVKNCLQGVIELQKSQQLKADYKKRIVKAMAKRQIYPHAIQLQKLK
ncbi:sulfotransferase [Coraliomargarita sp. SDUM461004]|uniref:Sulfotransferase n=1 Tax=Thalassobacterium sedimentorum TaxID=3041258 RepID=A0ABU1ALR7_9BACT|nr:sulfotransferase [Coraliomargarita sp. SDUM461004]MDQ8195153.1 sulfotransferase [Coraliomargarita sp. SDUM461004]